MYTLSFTDGQHKPVPFFIAFTLIDAIVVKHNQDDLYHWSIT